MIGRLSLVLGFLVVLALTSAACTSASAPAQQPAGGQSSAAPPPQTVELQFETYLPEPNAYSIAARKYMDGVAAASGGRIKMRYFWGGSLHGPEEMLKAITSGSSDIGLAASGYVISELPLSGAFELVYFSDRPDAVLRAGVDIYNGFAPYREEWETKHKIKLLFNIPADAMLTETKKPLNTVEDYKGLKFRSFGWLNDALMRFGATPVTIAQAEVYSSLEKGIVNGAWGMAFQPAWSMKHYEPAPYWSDSGVGVFAMMPLYMSMNSWNKIPADLQKVFADETQKFPAVYSKNMAEVNQQAAKDIATNKNVQFYDWPAAEKQKARNLVQPAQMNEWIKQTEQKGLPAKQFMDQVATTIKKYEPESTYKTGFEELKALGVNVSTPHK